MTIIAYKDGIVAADKMAINHDYKFKTTKIFKHHDIVMALSGDYARGISMINALAKKKDIPPPSGDEWATVIVFTKSKIICYENLNIPIIRKEKILAFGSGRDYALGCMYSGKTAIDAVKITNKLCASCGMGIDWINLND